MLAGALLGAVPHAGEAASTESAFTVREYRVPSGQHPHDVAPARDGGVWYTAQALRRARLARPENRQDQHVPLGAGSAPHGVIVGPDGAPWITDGGLNAIVRVDPERGESPLPAAVVERLREPEHGDLRPPRHPLVHRAERDLRSSRPAHSQAPCVLRSTRRRPLRHHHDAGRGRLLRVARRQLPRPDRRDPRHGARAPAADAEPGRAPGVVRLARTDLGQRVELRQARHVRSPVSPLARVAPARPEPDAVRGLRRRARCRLVERLRRQRARPLRSGHERFARVPLPSPGANVRQLLGRRGQVWGAESGTDKLVVVTTR